MVEMKNWYWASNIYFDGLFKQNTINSEFLKLYCRVHSLYNSILYKIQLLPINKMK